MSIISSKKGILFLSLLLPFSPFGITAEDEDNKERGGIEEVTVTAEKRESTVSDTSMSISAFDSTLIEDLGLQGPDDLMDQLPATTRDAFDVRIRGIGRNFRSLGGDPGVATYYNGVYSPDFGIAATENYYYDVERIEVLRGPQGTLYGRNSIGGAINYITKAPSFEPEGEVRMLAGDYSALHYYGLASGPVTDKLAYRISFAKMDRDGVQDCLGPCRDTDSLDDSNNVLTFLYKPSDDLEMQVRINDRLSDRIIGQRVLITEGYGPNRGTRNTTDEVYGLRAVPAGTPGAITFTSPVTGAVGYGAPLRAGVDLGPWPGAYNPAYGRTDNNVLGNFKVQVNDDPRCNKFPYRGGCDSNHSAFEHSGIQGHINWDVNDTTEIKYIYGYVDFDYNFNIERDQTDSSWNKERITVEEDTHMITHELNILWEIGSDIEVTSGIFYMEEQRIQDYTVSNSISAFMNPASYGTLDLPFPFLGGVSTAALLGATNLCVGGGRDWIGSGPLNTTISCRWGGNEHGDVYRHLNQVNTDATAYYTQATWTMDEEFALTLGVRHAEDEKSVSEKRGGYAELYLGYAQAWMPVLAAYAGQGLPLAELTAAGQGNFSFWSGAATQLTPLAYTNLAMGNAVYTANPAMPIAPKCAIQDQGTCATPMRLMQGFPYAYTSYTTGDDEWSDTNFRVNLDWTPNEDQLYYFSYTTGYRSGGYSLGVTGARDQARDSYGLPIAGSPLSPITYDKEEVGAFEVGYKGVHLDNNLQVFAAIYHYDYDGYQDQVETLDPTRGPNGSGVNLVTNADGITNQGWEVELTYQASERLTLYGNYSYTDTEYGEDYFILSIDDPAMPQSIFRDFTQDAVGITTIAGEGTNAFVKNSKGYPLKGIPETKYTLRATYEMDAGFGPVWWNLSHSYTGDFSASGIDRALDRVPDRDITNLSASWWSDDGNTSIRFHVANLTDEEDIYGLSSLTSNNNYQLYGSPLAPRTYYLDIRYKF